MQGPTQKVGVNNTMLVPVNPAEAEYILQNKRATTRRSGEAVKRQSDKVLCWNL